jgi:hypothetical protein
MHIYKGAVYMGTYTLTNDLNDYPNFKQYNYTLPPPFPPLDLK